MRALFFSTLILVCGLGCTSDATPGYFDGGGSVAMAGHGGAAPSDGQTPDSLEFEMQPELAARQQLTLKVRALPPRSYPVVFALPSSDGDPLDAVLDRSSATTDDSGIASVVLTAPSSPTTFSVRASVLTRSAQVSLTVADRGLATLQVEPIYPMIYPSALRDITTWIATAHVGKSCADVPGIPPPDGELTAPPAGREEAPVIPRVPASTPLAVTLRSGHFVGGCTSVEMVPPGPPDSPQVVKVTVLNRPIDLSRWSLDVSLGLMPGEQSWSSALSAAGTGIQAALLGNSADDVDALLAAMRNASGDSAQDFQDASDTEGWRALVRSRWGQNATTRLRDLVGTWLSSGRQRFAAAESPFVGSLMPLSDPQDAGAASSALLTIESVAGLDAASAGFVDAGQASWSAAADDTILLNTDIYFTRSQLAAALAEAAALNQATATNADLHTAPALLAAALDCQGVGSALAQAGTDTTLAYADCDATCLASLCERAAEALWRRGAESSGVDYSRLNVTATAAANVGDEAGVTGFVGTWLGELTDSSGTLTTGGAIKASAQTATP
jgi:hypothetical protein